ncbi:MAG TPA: SRPBCC domain-containing protein [Steroidobacteraceae bacterium]|nr:SRPBCC domain-containing protein [Steroidobacteraceae bacterium]
MTSRVFVALRVPADPARTFEAFTREIASWWQPDRLFRITPHGDGELAFEPGQGGRLITRLANGETYEIGRISVWEPGRRLVFGWRQASFSPEQATEVEVLFEQVGEETRVSIEHRAWDTIPQQHVARHGFPEHVTLQRVAGWWRASLGVLRERQRWSAPSA